MHQIQSNEQYYEESFNKLSASEINICDSEFEECEFNDCNFSSSTFASCRFINCTFKRCNLSIMNLSLTRISEVAFSECKLVGIDWTKAYWPDFIVDSQLEFTQCILNDASFFALTLHELKLNACKLHDVDFREGDFSNSTITYCDCTNSLFMHSNLQGVDFTESYNYDIDILENSIAKAKFSRYEALRLLDSLDIELVD